MANDVEDAVVGAVLGTDWLKQQVDDAAARLQATEADKIAMEENFHLHEEIKDLSAEDRDELFKILQAAQAGDRSQLEALFDVIYDEIPVPMDEFVLSKRYMGFKNDQGIKAKLDLLIRMDAPHVRQAWIAAGSGSGKGLMSGIMQAREVYQLLCLRNPALFYMLSPGASLAVANASTSRSQSKEVVFGELTARLKHSPWFAGKYDDPIAERIRFQKNVFAISVGRSPLALYGYNTKSGILDEAAFMQLGEVDIAEAIIEALSKSMHTRYPRAYKLLVISTLRGTDDIVYRNIARIKAEGVQLV